MPFKHNNMCKGRKGQQETDIFFFRSVYLVQYYFGLETALTKHKLSERATIHHHLSDMHKQWPWRLGRLVYLLPAMHDHQLSKTTYMIFYVIAYRSILNYTKALFQIARRSKWDFEQVSLWYMHWSYENFISLKWLAVNCEVSMHFCISAKWHSLKAISILCLLIFNLLALKREQLYRV